MTDTTTEEWVEAVTAGAEPPTVEVKLFGKWNPDEIHVNDISLAVSRNNSSTSMHLVQRLCAVLYSVWFSGMKVEWFYFCHIW